MISYGDRTTCTEAERLFEEASLYVTLLVGPAALGIDSVVVVVPTATAVGFQMVIRSSVGVERLELNNEVAGFMFAAIGVVYAVLLAFVVIAVWEKFSEGQTTGARESRRRICVCFTMPKAPSRRPPSSTTVSSIISGSQSKRTGPPRRRDSEDRDTSHALDQLYRAAMALNQTSTRSTADMSEVFTQIDNLTLARRVRLHLSTELVRDASGSRFAGAGLTVYFALFSVIAMGSRNWR